MDKSKRKGKPNRRRFILIILITIFSCCMLTTILLFDWLNNPRYQLPIFADIEEGLWYWDLVEARLLEHMIIGESTRLEVEAFAEEYLKPEEFPCSVFDETSQVCYEVDIQPIFHCVGYRLRITFTFQNNILNDIGFDNRGSCL